MYVIYVLDYEHKCKWQGLGATHLNPETNNDYGK